MVSKKKNNRLRLTILRVYFQEYGYRLKMVNYWIKKGRLTRKRLKTNGYHPKCPYHFNEIN